MTLAIDPAMGREYHKQQWHKMAPDISMNKLLRLQKAPILKQDFENIPY
jgi:hypothetical protein